MHIIGIVGTAKNTGKTTTLAALIGEAGRRGVRIGVTGIGYDGEEIDTVTGLPKPRLLLQSGTIVATSEQCLLATTAEYVVVKKTDARTALGAVVIVEIRRPGLMVLAGPNTKRLLKGVILELESLGLGAVFVDGSLNRIAAMSVVDTMVFTTGASRTTEISFLSEEARAICGLFQGSDRNDAWSAVSAGPQADVIAIADTAESLDTVTCSAAPDGILLQDDDGRIVERLPMLSLFDADDARTAVNAMSGRVTRISVPNMVSLQALENVVGNAGAAGGADRTTAAGFTITLADPTIALLAGEPLATYRCVNDAKARGVSIGYRRSIRVAAMTVNPFYPRQQDHSFLPAYVDKDRLLRSVADAVDVPVFNIKDDGAVSLLYEILFV